MESIGEPRPIGIWRPAEVDGEPAFVRPEPGPFGDHWAARRMIPQRLHRRRRICLLGESAAAGYLLAPHLTPAAVLEQRLGREWEVVDLARTNERLAGMIDTAEAALQLEPERLVVLTGNNWNLLETPELSPYAPSTAARQEMAAAIRRQGLAGPARLAAGRLRRLAERAFERLARLGVPVTVVVPEVCLADWQSPQPVLWRPGDGVARWYRLLALGRRALAEGRPAEARRLALELTAIDGGGCPTGYRLLARASQALDRVEDARTAARAEVDAVRYAAMALLPAPQAGAAVQSLLGELAGRHRFEVVDLTRVFGERERLPGRRWFYDYCHLTPEGIDLAMTAVARSLGAVAGGDPPPLGARQRATAELGAAVHGVHRGAHGEVVRWWLRRALATDAAAAGAMLDLVAARAAPVPAVMMPAQLDEPWLAPQHGWRWPDFDAEVVAAIGEVLGWRRVGPRLGPPRVEPWSRLDRFYPEAVEHDDLPRPGVLRSPWPWTALCLVSDQPAEVELVARLPPACRRAGGSVAIECDGQPVARYELGAGWTVVRIPVPGGVGLRRLTVRWPLPEGAGERAIEAAVARLERGQPADLHPVFGELCGMRVG